MAEAGGPSIAEVQSKPAGVVEKVKNKLREMFTPTGRAEVMADKQIKTILDNVAPEDRVKAMEHLEKMRPDLVAGKMEDAKGSLVRDAVVVSAVAGTALVGAGAAYVKRDAIMNAAFSMGIRKSHLSESGQKKFVEKVAGMRKAKFVESIRKATDPVRGFMNGMKLWPFNKLDANHRESAPPTVNQPSVSAD
ncbi:hypothetical protein HY949_02010 [Candidatus Gottesmanbacteria bacterium]|nr:hypothetical protein [Candidatus Gottesmanbacteria bacterium]